MKKIVLIACAVFGIVTLPMWGRADTFTINNFPDGADTYWGGMVAYPDPAYPGSWPSASDALGGHAYEVDTMTVNRENGLFSVQLAGPFFASTVAEVIGDLFLCSYGWNPYSTGPSDPHYATDNRDSPGAEIWNYVLHIDTMVSPTDGITGGTIGLYQTSDGVIKYTEDFHQASYYREGQEVRYEPGVNQTSPLAVGEWALDPNAGLLTFTLDTSSLDAAFLADLYGSDIGLHWTMACGNDVIEGSSNVPEPATMLLFATGLSGLALYRRRAKK